jgi:hypothetical protein
MTLAIDVFGAGRSASRPFIDTLGVRKARRSGYPVMQMSMSTHGQMVPLLRLR